MAPTRFPVPTCAAIAVATAWKELIPCFPASFPLNEKLPKRRFQPAPNFVNCTPPNRIVKNKPVPHRSGMRK